MTDTQSSIVNMTAVIQRGLWCRMIVCEASGHNQQAKSAFRG